MKAVAQEKEESGDYGARGADNIFKQQAVDANGNFNINLVDGVERFTNKVLFMASVCQKVIGVEWQKRQMLGHVSQV